MQRASSRKSETAGGDGKKSGLAGLTFGALGIVFGDIGTSPLYAMHQCFQDLHGPADPRAVLGILSLIFWSLILVVSVKYLTFIIRLDHDGEGGTLALLGLLQSKEKPRRGARQGALVLLVLFGSALLYGDGVITPSISVLSAVEGLRMATPAAQSFVVPVALGILIALFVLQKQGTHRVGSWFGPVMVLWFVAIAVLGVRGIGHAPQVLAALNPMYAASFLAHAGGRGVIVLGAVVLCFSGAEALFADLGHFGRLPIRLAWYALVLPALVLNYFGEGAMMLDGGGGDSPFFALVPHGALYPMVALSTLATIIASQALVSGAFSLTEQAIHLGYFPRFKVVQTSAKERGQVYVGVVNWALMLGCIAVVLGFRSSDRLAGAYGLAVIGTMTITSITSYAVVRRVRRWPRAVALALGGAFLVVDLAFLAGNLVKILTGAWVPLLIAGFVFAIFWIWAYGHARYLRALAKLNMPIADFTRHVTRWEDRSEGTAVFLTAEVDAVPLVGGNEWLRQHACHEQVMLVTVIFEKVPYVREEEMDELEKLAPGFFRITAHVGFMQQPDITRILRCRAQGDLKIDWEKLICFLPEPTLVSQGSAFHRAVQYSYDFLRRNSQSAVSYFRIPASEVVLLGVRLDV